MMPMKQTCKHCGTEVTGEVAVRGGGGFVGPGGKLPEPTPLGYSFTCNGPGEHGEGNKDREWLSAVPDPVGDEAKRQRGLSKAELPQR